MNDEQKRENAVEPEEVVRKYPTPETDEAVVEQVAEWNTGRAALAVFIRTALTRARNEGVDPAAAQRAMQRRYDEGYAAGQRETCEKIREKHPEWDADELF